MNSPLRVLSAKRITSCKSEIRTRFIISKKQLPIDALEEVLQLKKQINALTEENKRLKLDKIHLQVNHDLKQKQLNKQEKVIAIAHSKHKTESQDEAYIRQYTEETGQVIACQKQICALESQLKTSNLQIEELKRDCKRTKLQECQIECQAYKELYEQQNAKFQVFIKQNELKKKGKLLKENLILSQEINSNNSLIHELKNTINKYEHEIQQYISLKRQMEKTLIEKDKEINLIRFEFTNPRKTIHDLTRSYSSQIEQLQQIICEKDALISQQILCITNQNHDMIEKQSITSNKETYLKKEIENLNNQIDALRKIIANMEQEAQEEKESSIISIKNTVSQKIISSKRSFLKKRLQKVAHEEVQPFGQILTGIQYFYLVKFQSLQLKYLDVELLIINKQQKGMIYLNELVDLFQQHPFDLNDKDSLIMARYIVEPEQEEWVYNDLEQCNDLRVVISIFRNLIKPYQLIPQEEIEALRDQLNQILKRDQGKIGDYLHLQGETCTYAQFLNALDYCDVKLNKKQEQYLSIKVYEDNKQFSSLRYQMIFSLFA